MIIEVRGEEEGEGRDGGRETGEGEKYKLLSFNSTDPFQSWK